MALSEDWFLGKVAELSNESARNEVLSELKTAVFSLNSSQLKRVAQAFRLDLIFDCLNSSDSNQISEACDVLYPLLSSFDPACLLNEYEKVITRALGHPSPKLRALVLKELCRVANHSPQLAERICQEDILLTIVETVGGGPIRSPKPGRKNNPIDDEEEQNEASAGRAAVKLLSLIACNPHGLSLFSTGSVVISAIKEQSQRSDVVRYRFYEVLVEVAISSPEGLSAVIDTGLLSQMLKEAVGEAPADSSVDILAQANALQLLGKLAAPEHGARYVNDVGVAETLAQTLARASEDPLSSSLLLPELLKFFGGIGHIRPHDVLSTYPAFANSLFDALSSADVSIIGVAMETVGFVGLTGRGKQALYALHGVQMAKFMRRLGELMVVLPTPHRVRALNSLSSLMTLKAEEHDKEMLAITQRWFDGMSPTKVGSTQWASAELIASICRQPFVELQLAGVQVFLCLATLPWGQRLIATCPGLLEFLTGYGNEEGKVRESKYAVSKALLGSSTTSNSLSQSQMLRLETFVQAGPHGRIIGPSEVAIDGAS
ncbi:26S proteasome non-ATPase regulatory subunit 5-like [Ischnura elegans]|uniref:26S proteasome non-ATPase regulatory subunit 5-like n=1 Tax=Ischnura elegans TaxID=197161 RepID=UPI001ED87559|nr:26S proteasome non-ATPase regulatory subunit 5-like [Ischnura elegans]